MENFGHTITASRSKEAIKHRNVYFSTILLIVLGLAGGAQKPINCTSHGFIDTGYVAAEGDPGTQLKPELWLDLEDFGGQGALPPLSGAIGLGENGTLLNGGSRLDYEGVRKNLSGLYLTKVPVYLEEGQQVPPLDTNIGVGGMEMNCSDNEGNDVVYFVKDAEIREID